MVKAVFKNFVGYNESIIHNVLMNEYLMMKAGICLYMIMP